MDQAHIRLVVQDEVSESGARRLLCGQGVVSASNHMVAPFLHQQHIDVGQQRANVFDDLVQLPIAAPNPAVVNIVGWVLGLAMLL